MKKDPSSFIGMPPHPARQMNWREGVYFPRNIHIFDDLAESFGGEGRQTQTGGPGRRSPWRRPDG